MNKLYFLVLLLISLGCSNAIQEPLAVWFSAIDTTMVVNTSYISTWRSTRPADNPMKPYLTAKNRATVGQIVVNANKPNNVTYNVARLVNSCLKMSGYYSVQTNAGWAVAYHGTKGNKNLPGGYIFGGSHQDNTPAIRTIVGGNDFEFYSCNGYVGTTGNLCESHVIKSGLALADKAMVTVIVSYAPASTGGNTTIYFNGVQVLSVKTKTNSKNWDLNAVGCSGWGDTKQSQAFIADFRIYEGQLNAAQAKIVHDEMKNRSSTYEAPSTPAPVVTTPAPQPTIPAVVPNVTADVGCSGHGYYLSTDATRCVCNSGREGEHCELTTAADNNCTANIAQILHDQWYPKINTAGNHSSFAAGSLYAEIVGDHVKNRTFGGITFRDANESRCFLGTRNSFWMQTVDNCSDTFTLLLPWRDYAQSCGFSKRNSTGSRTEYRGIIEMTYFDTLLDRMVLGQYLVRKTRVKFELYLTFPTSVNIKIEQVDVNSNVSALAAISRFEWDSDKQVVVFQVVTRLNWPNMLSEDGMSLIIPATVDFASPMTLNSDACPNVEGSYCTQVFEIELQLVDFDPNPISPKCSFDGDYQLNVTIVTCREPGALGICSTANSMTTPFMDYLKYSVEDSLVCGEVSTAPQVTATLTAYDDLDYSVESVEGILGSSGFFEVNVDAPDENEFNFKFIDIVIDDGVNTTYLHKDGEITDKGEGCALTVYHSIYRFNITYTPEVFTVAPMQTVLYTFAVRVEITYQGNDGFVKREIREINGMKAIESFYSPPQKSGVLASTNMNMKNAAPVAAEPVTEVTHATKDNRMMLLTVIVPAAGVVVLSVLAASIYYIYKVSKKQQTPFYSKL